MRALLFAYAISTLPSSAPNSRRDNVLQLPTKNFAKKTKLYAFAMQSDMRLCRTLNYENATLAVVDVLCEGTVHLVTRHPFANLSIQCLRYGEGVFVPVLAFHAILFSGQTTAEKKHSNLVL